MTVKPRPSDDVFVAYRFPQAKSKVIAMLMWVSKKKLEQMPKQIVAERVRFG